MEKHICEYLSNRDTNCRASWHAFKYSMEDEFSVALCIGGMAQADDIASDVGVIFSEMFRTDEHLDVIHVSERQGTN